ncbi:hypothetical protein ACLOJK_010551 [Asimina triloba]
MKQQDLYLCSQAVREMNFDGLKIFFSFSVNLDSLRFMMFKFLEFASEIFHDLHEQVSATAARSHRMMARVQQVEAALPPLEKAVFAQTSHLHFAYAPGSEWHADIHTEHSHLGQSDLPSFIMNSYEECRDPPRLFLLDKFDTAGAGVCLKRYSDPSFFKTFWANSELASAEKSKRDRKTYKSKKKAVYQGNGKIQNAASVSQRYARIRLASPDTSGGSVAAETISRSGIRSKFDLEIRSTNTSKLQSHFAEHVVDISSSTEHEVRQSSNLTPSKRRTSDNETNPTIPLDDQNTVGVDIDSPHKLLQGPSDPGSSSITWDEKMEIAKPTREASESISHDQREASEDLPGNCESKMGQEAASLSKMHQEDIVFDVHNVPESYSSRDQSDEFVSETDNYADALNTIESEVETDSECQTKREVEQKNDLKHQELDIGTSEIHDLDAQNSNSSEDVSSNPSQLVYSENLAHACLPEMTGMASNIVLNLHGDSNALDASRIDVLGSSNGNPSGSDIPCSHGNNITVIPSMSQESQGISNVPSVNIWTNGGLLGLQPSKPPDFSASSVVSQSPSSGAENANASVESNGHRQHKSSLAEEHDLVDITAATPGSDLPCVSDTQLQSGHSAENNNEISSSISTADCMPPVRGPLRKESPSHNDSSESSIAVSVDPMKSQGRPIVEQKKQRNGVSWTSHEATLKEQPQLGSPEIFTSSKSYHFSYPSPPLEHMKISFHPMNGMETSKLNLEFPNGHHFNKIIEDPECPSFQLLPKLAVPIQEIASESDDDTFYKSSPYPSDDILSPHSESDSEQWESAEMTGSKDQDIYDTLWRVPSNSSFTSSSEAERMMHQNTHVAPGGNSNSENVLQSIDTGASLYTPQWDTKISFTNHVEAKGDSDAKNLLDLVLQYPEQLPPPPPLPPLQWIVMKPKSSSAEYKEHKVSDANNLPKDQPVQGHIALASLLPEPAPPKLPHSEAATVSLGKGIHDLQKPNRLRETSKAANGKVLDEKEDFLHQIRNKFFEAHARMNYSAGLSGKLYRYGSFNLRPTVSTRPSIHPGPTTNINVVAILEKANAIRQAYVGSDDGGDDENWSPGYSSNMCCVMWMCRSPRLQASVGNWHAASNDAHLGLAGEWRAGVLRAGMRSGPRNKDSCFNAAPNWLMGQVTVMSLVGLVLMVKFLVSDEEEEHDLRKRLSQSARKAEKVFRSVAICDHVVSNWGSVVLIVVQMRKVKVKPLLN